MMHLKKLLIFVTILLIALGVHFNLQAAQLDLTVQDRLLQAENYLSLANNSLPPQTYHYELLAADIYIQINALHKAQAILATLPQIGLEPSLKQFKEQLESTLFKTHERKRAASTPHLGASHIALFLPLAGPYAQPAQAIKAGFLAHHQDNALPVKIYDTSKTSNICALYHQAAHEGAEFIVGPLIKEEVYQLSKLSPSSLSVPILTLNTHPNVQIAPSLHFFQFALSPEEEIVSLANKAWAHGHRSTSIIVPDNDWGKRVLSAFSKQWQSLGGKIPSTVLIKASQDPALVVRSLLKISASYDPKKNQKNKIKLPARRQDIDMIVLATPPEQARQLRPMLDFYEAQDLKVYSTSSIYSGIPSPQQDRDINGVIFCDMPFILENHSNHPLGRLYAMGLDAYQLMSRLAILSQSSNAQYHGATGLLSIGPNHKIERALSWAQIKNGIPTAL